jgi:ribonucleoside-diphosphate reductase alpha chain
MVPSKEHLTSIISPLTEKGFIAEELAKLDTAVESAFDIAFVFNHYALGEECLQRFGLHT